MSRAGFAPRIKMSKRKTATEVPQIGVRLSENPEHWSHSRYKGPIHESEPDFSINELYEKTDYPMHSHAPKWGMYLYYLW